jgi:hypothetical protein
VAVGTHEELAVPTEKSRSCPELAKSRVPEIADDRRVVRDLHRLGMV